MKNLRKLPALFMAVMLVVASSPAWPGGRDVPDRNSEDGSGPGSRRPPVVGSAPQCEDPTTTRFTWGGIRWDLVQSRDGGFVAQPTMLSAGLRLLGAVFVPGDEDSDTCLTR